MKTIIYLMLRGLTIAYRHHHNPNAVNWYPKINTGIDEYGISHLFQMSNANKSKTDLHVREQVKLSVDVRILRTALPVKLKPNINSSNMTLFTLA